ncbi:MAG: MopE-related protein [bacterium]
MPELCNGSDDNCNGQIDETFPNLGMACQNGVGICARDGIYVCADDQMDVTCNAPEPGDPRAELCNGDDDDCDGSVDETFPELGEACTAGQGACIGQGVMMCTPDGMGTICTAQAKPMCCGNNIVEAGEDQDDGGPRRYRWLQQRLPGLWQRDVRPGRDARELPRRSRPADPRQRIWIRGALARTAPLTYRSSGTICGDGYGRRRRRVRRRQPDNTDTCNGPVELCGNGICGKYENSTTCRPDLPRGRGRRRPPPHRGGSD